MVSNRFQVQNRAEFDEFWARGVELWRYDAAKSTPDTAVRVARSTVLDAPPDPPIDPQVWWRYATLSPDDRIDLLINPGPQTGTALAATQIQQQVIDGAVTLEGTLLAEGFGYLALRLEYEHMVQRLLPLTSWASLLSEVVALTPTERANAMRLYSGLEAAGSKVTVPSPKTLLLGWMLHLVVFCKPNGKIRTAEVTYGSKSKAFTAVNELLAGVRMPTQSPSRLKGIGRVTLNRTARSSVARSSRTVKVDATRKLFGVRCDNIRWAIVDSGIDARHRAFRRSPPAPESDVFANPFENDGVAFNYTRVIQAFDFTRQRTSGAFFGRGERARDQLADGDLTGDIPIALDLGERWYEPPEFGHGTHIAGIIGGSDGLCPDIEMLDYRVLDADGRGNEFVIVSALRHILGVVQRSVDPTGRSRDLPIHGVNLSLALDVDVTSDACGWSLVCRACDDLVRAGVVVVVSAGNTGFEDRAGETVSTGQNYRTVSITDPGNTERVITVGSTDADRPREYGVSFFSARGPTADGRSKPDLVAPGNAIRAAYGYKRGDDDRTDEYATLDGTSQAAAHVSGCAATLMAHHRELIGKPEEVKQILMASATDLGRNSSFQGAGMVDALRAVQSV